MKDTDYTFAVARIRANEVKLLGESDYQSLLSAADYTQTVQKLNEYGYAIEGNDYSSVLEKKTEELHQLMFELLPDKAQLDSIFVYNDFANLKVMLKALITSKSTDGLLVSPTLFNTQEVKAAVFERRNDRLPPMLAHADRSAYRILTKTGYAQLADAVVDRAAMEHSAALADKADNGIMKRLADIRIAVTDMKVLYRCIKACKADSFMLRSVAKTTYFDITDAVKAAGEGEEALTAFFQSTSLGGLAKAFGTDPTAFEKLSDDAVMHVLKAEKWHAFGIAPLVGYYFGALTEITNLRIILSGKLNGQPIAVLSERMRESYV